MLTYDPDDDYWNAVCLLLPGSKATLVDVDTFDRYGHLEWRVMGSVIHHQERYTKIVNPTAWRRNQKSRVRYRMVTLSRLVLGLPEIAEVFEKLGIEPSVGLKSAS